MTVEHEPDIQTVRQKHWETLHTNLSNGPTDPESDSQNQPLTIETASGPVVVTRDQYMETGISGVLFRLKAAQIPPEDTLERLYSSPIHTPQEKPHSRPYIWTDEKLTALADMVRSGQTDKQIAEDLHINLAALNRAITLGRAKGIIPHRSTLKNAHPQNSGPVQVAENEGLQNERNDFIDTLWKQGKTAREIRQLLVEANPEWKLQMTTIQQLIAAKIRQRLLPHHVKGRRRKNQRQQ